MTRSTGEKWGCRNMNAVQYRNRSQLAQGPQRGGATLTSVGPKPQTKPIPNFDQELQFPSANLSSFAAHHLMKDKINCAGVSHGRTVTLCGDRPNLTPLPLVASHHTLNHC